MNPKNLIKAANSKGKLAKAVIQYQQALAYYANENNWAVRGDDILWVGSDDPTQVADVVLGKRKNEPITVRKTDKSKEPINGEGQSSSQATGGQGGDRESNAAMEQGNASSTEHQIRKEQDRASIDSLPDREDAIAKLGGDN